MDKRNEITLMKTVTLGAFTTKRTETVVTKFDDTIYINQYKKVAFLGESNKEVEILISDVTSVDLRTTFDIWNTGLAIFAFITSIIVEYWLIILLGLFILWTAYGKLVTIKSNQGVSIDIPSGSKTTVDEFLTMINK